MEKRTEYCKGLIPVGAYETNLNFGEEKGLEIELFNADNHIVFDFGNVFSFRILEEGYVQSEVYSGAEINKYKNDKFSNIIYRLEGGEYASYIKKIADGYLDDIELFHFVIITQNYNIDIVSCSTPKCLVNGNKVDGEQWLEGE